MSAPLSGTFCLNTNFLNSLRDSSYKAAAFDRVDDIDYQTFFYSYLLPNKPCIFSPRVTRLWKSRSEWTDENNAPAFSRLRSEFGTESLQGQSAYKTNRSLWLDLRIRQPFF